MNAVIHYSYDMMYIYEISVKQKYIREVLLWYIQLAKYLTNLFHFFLFSFITPKIFYLFIKNKKINYICY